MPPEPRRPERPFEEPFDEPFDEPWQARAFALTLALHEADAFGWDEWTVALSDAVAADPARPYWLAWLAALERVAIAKGLSDAQAIAAMARAWRAAADRTPHGEPIVLERT